MSINYQSSKLSADINGACQPRLQKFMYEYVLMLHVAEIVKKKKEKENINIGNASKFNSLG